MITDIVLCTRNRLEILKRTLTYLFERTITPFRLHIIDDASTDGTVSYLQSLLDTGIIVGFVARVKSEPIGANWNAAAKLAKTDVLVFTDDDILCPKLDPDWLSRGLIAMAQHPKVGLMALEDPMCTFSDAIKVIGRESTVTLCNRVGGHLAFVRRELMRSIVIPPIGGRLAGYEMIVDSRRLDKAWSQAVREKGYTVAYLTGVYCQHIGLVSMRNGQDLRYREVVPINGNTLEPPEKWKS
jgi:glycosyltransferase involved in cell wall biosynthesis